MLRKWLLFTLLAVFAVGLVEGCSNSDTVAPVSDDMRVRFDLQTLGPTPYPPDNPPRQERIALGRLLFYDPLLGGEMDVACGTCHHPNFAFADKRQFGAGVSGIGLGPERLVSLSAVSHTPINLEPRNTPTVFNAAFNAPLDGQAPHMGMQFWDGRVSSLEVQATKPIASRVEMRGDKYPGDDAAATAVGLDSVLTRLRQVPEYIARFRDAFPEEAQKFDDGVLESVIDSSTYARAIGAFERELVTRNSAYDRYVRGDDNALDDQQKAGMELFFTKAKCSACHNGPMFSNFEFVVQGVPQEGFGKVVIPGDDTGREEATLNDVDRFAFRTATLRNIELTPPYMHDGVFETLEEVVRFYNDGCQPRHPSVTNDMLDPDLLAPLGLTNDEIQSLVAFLRSLTDPGTQLDPFLLQVPERVPSGLVPVFGVKAQAVDAQQDADPTLARK